MKKTFDILSNAKWIGANESAESPIIIKKFHARKVTNAEIYVTGLGYFEAKINGVDITNERLLPIASDYEKRDLSTFAHKIDGEFTHRIYYHKYNINDLLFEGENTLTLQLGNGWYRQRERTCECKANFGEVLKTIFAIELNYEAEKEYIYSDGSEKWVNGNILYNNIFVGEVIDNTFFDSDEKNVSVLPDSNSTLSEAKGVSDKVIREITPKAIAKLEDSTVFDCGENITGVVSVTARGKVGDKVTLRFAENLNEDNSLNFFSAGCHYGIRSGGQQIQSDTFILKDGENYFEPKFVWHAFRYFEVQGDFENVKVKVIHSDVTKTATFSSDSEGLNFLFDAFIRSQLGNMHGSFPSDCPHRERLGYTGDGQIASRAAMLMLDAKKFYAKWIQDILDCQDPNTGHVRHTAPYMGGGGGPVGWGGAIAVVPYNFYKIYGDKSIIEKTLPYIDKWLNFIKSCMVDGLIAYEVKGAWFLGDWCTFEETKIPADFVNTCLLMNVLLKCEEMAKAVGTDFVGYLTLYKECEKAIIDKCFDGENYCGGVQGADAFAVYAGIKHGNPLAAVKARYEKANHFDTGFIGTDVLVEVLFNNGLIDLAYKLLNGNESGSFLYMKKNGATTVWEAWNDLLFSNISHNHPMFGACSRQIFESILGITQSYGEGGFNNVVISPKIPQKMKFAEGSITTAIGEICVKWERRNSEIHFDFEMPINCKAKFVLEDFESEINAGKSHLIYKI